MRLDFRGRTVGHEEEIVVGDLGDVDSCDVVCADFSEPDEGTAMEAGTPAPSVSQSSPTPAGRRLTPGSCTSQARCTESWERP
jgi:hypothetical protein